MCIWMFVVCNDIFGFRSNDSCCLLWSYSVVRYNSMAFTGVSYLVCSVMNK